MKVIYDHNCWLQDLEPCKTFLWRFPIKHFHNHLHFCKNRTGCNYCLRGGNKTRRNEHIQFNLCTNMLVTSNCQFWAVNLNKILTCENWVITEVITSIGFTKFYTDLENFKTLENNLQFITIYFGIAMN